MEPADSSERTPDGAEPRRARRLADVVTPVLAGLLVDATDLATFGPIGLWLGGLAGALVGWQLAPQLGFARRPWIPCLLAGVYCMTPGTAFVPLATLLAGIGALAGATRPDGARADAIEADYRSRWDDAGGDARD